MTEEEYKLHEVIVHIIEARNTTEAIFAIQLYKKLFEEPELSVLQLEVKLQRTLRKEVSEELTPLETLIAKYAGAYSTPEATTLQVLQDLLKELQGWCNGHVLQGFQEDLTAMHMRALDAEKEVVKLKEELSNVKAIIEEYDIRPDC